MTDSWTDRKPNPKFPACAYVARRLLAEVWGCKPGGEIPAEAELLERAREVAAAGSGGNVSSLIALAVPGGWHDYGVAPHDGATMDDAAKAQTALNMLNEIGGF